MPQKGQITKHEWNNIPMGGQRCIACGVERHKMFLVKYWSYYAAGSKMELANTPECITKTTGKEAGSNGKAT